MIKRLKKNSYEIRRVSYIRDVIKEIETTKVDKSLFNENLISIKTKKQKSLAVLN
jgi:hypothetical protein